ncbi:MAG: class I SAM-dependent methyltransferase [Candidatus Glassbacteria bacterium]|nr:class I SAM-dependent methyltransferase [Candidatus Glassbacteria bacterium]
MDVRQREWLFYCRGCDLWTSSLDTDSERTDLVYTHDEQAFQQLRTNHSAVIFEALAASGALEGLTMLDVGSSYGWFMEAARERGILPCGLEPQEEKAQRAIEKGLAIQLGYFPDDLDYSGRYDIIAFNDVLEHFRDADAAVRAARDILRPGGRLIVCCPDSHGLYYRLSLLLSRAGWKNPLDRLWQKGYPSPHLYYFSSASLEKLVARHGFGLVEDRELEASTIKGLWQRIHVDREKPSVFSVFLYVAALITHLVLQKLFKSDARLQIYRKLPEGRQAGSPLRESGASS